MNETLQLSLASVIDQLAEFFGTTTDTIAANGPQWLAKYGWYNWASSGVVCSLIISIGITAIVFFVLLELLDGDELPIKQCIIVFIVSFTFISFLFALPCIISPEFAGLDAMLKLLGS